MKWIIDRLEGDYALCETDDKTILNIPKASLPPEIKEGDVLCISVDNDETESRRNNINRLMNDLFTD